MQYRKIARRSLAPAVVEPLEGRQFLSASPAVAAPVVHSALLAPATKTTLRASLHTARLGQPINVTAVVKAPRRLGAPAGVVEFLDNGNVIQQLSGDPLAVAVDARGRASYSFGAGNVALYIGKHTITAQFISSNSLPDSTSRISKVNVVVPKVRVTSSGLQVGILRRGVGVPISLGQTATVLYTGFLPATGEIFDYSSDHDPATLSYRLGYRDVVPGFDDGTIGMKIGETRALAIPSTLAYGANAVGTIPANSNLVFLITLVSYS